MILNVSSIVAQVQLLCCAGGASSLHDGDVGTGPPETIGDG